MLLSTPMGGGPLAYRGPQTISAAQRSAALAAVVGLHVGLIGILVFAQMHPPAPPPQPTLTVSFVTESAAAEATAPPPPPTAQPQPQPPERQMLATPRPTASTMTAPPVEKPPQPATSAPAVPATPAPSVPTTAPAAPSATSSATAATPTAAAGPSRTASYLKNPAMAYPMASRRLREQGVALVRVQVGADGVPVQTILSRSSGSTNLDNAALDFVKKYARFSAAKEGDRSVAGWVVLPFEFSLKTR